MQSGISKNMVSTLKKKGNPFTLNGSLGLGIFRLGLLITAFLFAGTQLRAAEPDPAAGKTLFEGNCKACHNIQLEKDMTGPALMGVSDRWSAAGLPPETKYDWVKNSGALTATVPYFKDLFGKWKSAMTAFPNMPNDQIDNIWAFIDSYQPSAAPTSTASGPTIDAEQQAQLDGLWSKLKVVMFLLVVLMGIIAVKVAKLRGVKLLDGVNMDKLNANVFLVFWIVGSVAAVWSIFSFKRTFLFFDSASEHGIGVDRLFWITMTIVMVVFFLTNSLLLFFSFKYRRDDSRKALYYPENHKLELIWTVIPAIALTILITFGIFTWRSIMKDPEAGTQVVGVEVNGQQFGWTVRYPGKDNKFGPANVRMIGGDNILGVDFSKSESHDDFIADTIVLPVGKLVDLNIRSRDVLHSAYLPHFRVKMDAVPGLPTRFRFTPIITTDSMRAIKKDPNFNYELACAEVCGRGHFSMRRIVKVVSQPEFDAWYERAGKATLFKPEAPVVVSNDHGSPE